ncbi:MAG: class I SAM-dependent methyltransferase [Planctomycetia bacterium]|nr:class I SAM-dependent methyltransferase [Planctomycetia bacterium]
MPMVLDRHLGGYFAGGDPGTWCPRLWSWAVRRFGVRSVLDVGCGEGHSTRFFRELSCDVLGVEGSAEAIAHSTIPDAMAQHDFCRGPFRPSRRFDMVWCCEFVEHVEERYVPHILETFQLADRCLLLTHAFPGQKGHHHVNCRPGAYWIDLIERAGFRLSLRQTLAARRVTHADYHRVNHFGRSGLVFVPRSQTAGPTVDSPEALTPAPPSLGARARSGFLLAEYRLAKLAKKLDRAVRGKRAAEGEKAAQ